MLFQIIKIKNMAHDASRDPGRLAAGLAGEALLGILIVPAISTLLFLALFFVLGYTHLLGGPFGFFRFLFIVFTLCVISVSWLLWKVHRAVRRATRHTVNSTLKVESKVVE